MPAAFPVYATHRIVEDSTMDTRRFRNREQSVAAFRWLGWVMLMMFVLVQTVQATPAGSVVTDVQRDGNGWRPQPDRERLQPSQPAHRSERPAPASPRRCAL